MSQHENDRPDDSKRHSRFSRWDIVAILLVAIVGLGILLPALQNLQERNRPICQNNLRRIGLGLIAAETMYGRLPPAFGSYGDRPVPIKAQNGEMAHHATLFYFLLPHLGYPGIYQRMPPLYHYPADNQYVVAPAQPLGGMADENAAEFVVPLYRCPSDTNADPTGIAELSLTPGKAAISTWGQNSYAANYLLFGMIKKPRLPESVPDGVSTTIFFTEKASLCDDIATGRKGGNLWAVPPFFPGDPNALINYGGTLGFDPAESNPSKPYAMALFQVQPVSGKCDPTLAQSPHQGGINVCMGDGSVRFILATVNAKTWSALLTPYPIQAANFPGGAQSRSDFPGSDWD